MSKISISDIERIIPYLTLEERNELQQLMLSENSVWSPLPGPQTEAYNSEADVLGYGGAAGGGKTDLAVGLALTRHTRTAIFRREGPELTSIVDRIRELIGSSEGYNGSQKIWREPVPGVQIDFGSCPNLGDERKHQGRAKDLLVCDEATHFIEAQIRYLMGWVRTVLKDQHCQTLLTFNPPENMDAMWVERFFAPWLGDKYANPAPFGSMRYFATFKGKDFEVDSLEPFKHKGELLVPQSRTFIFSRVTDNPYLARSGYIAQLQAMPEPHRSRLLYGDFKAMRGENPLQVIPTQWVDQAMARWKPMSIRRPMTSMGVDVARGGKDSTAIARRHDNWFDEPLKYPGTETPDGPKVAGLVLQAWRDNCSIHIDSIGIGASPFDFLKEADLPVVGVVANASPKGTDKSGLMLFGNYRAELWWKMREALDPANGRLLALPESDDLRQDLCTPTWGLRGKTVYVESREDIIKRLGRSPDLGTAYIQALIDTPTLKSLGLSDGEDNGQGHDPFAILYN